MFLKVLTFGLSNVLEMFMKDEQYHSKNPPELLG